jgi:hypothetical protein
MLNHILIQLGFPALFSYGYVVRMGSFMYYRHVTFQRSSRRRSRCCVTRTILFLFLEKLVKLPLVNQGNTMALVILWF